MYDDRIKKLNKFVKTYNLVLHQEFLNQTIEFTLNKSFWKKNSLNLLFKTGHVRNIIL